MKLKHLVFGLAAVVLLSLAFMSIGCGRSTVSSELIGQVKKVQKHTPLVCPDYTTADVSLGIMQNGVGSYSNQDVWLTIPSSQADKFQQAVENGRPVKIHYDTWRITPCSENAYATDITYLDIPPQTGATPTPTPPASTTPTGK